MIAIGLGSNENSIFGTSAETLREALRRLISGPKPLLTQARPSRVYRSPALLPEHAPASWDKPFLNMCVIAETEHTPQKLLAELKNLEKTFGRNARERWAPRPLDLDLLFWEQIEMQTPELTLPHPELAKRPFVTLPLSDLLPEMRVFRFAAHELPSIDVQATRKVLGPELVGILNLTPDSFSDGGRFHSIEKALTRIEQWVSSGVRIIDIGGESTRPGAQSLSADEEITRLKPFLKEVSRFKDTVFSIDTRHPKTAAFALEMGCRWVNDVMGAMSIPDFKRDDEMARLVRETHAHYVIMHSLDVPVQKQNRLDTARDPLVEVKAKLVRRCEALMESGVEAKKIIVDLGIGFGKTPEQSFELLHEAESLLSLHQEIRHLVGHSRKSFLQKITAVPFADRDPETHAITLAMAPHTLRGVDYLRVHECETHERMLRAFYSLWKPYPTLMSSPI